MTFDAQPDTVFDMPVLAGVHVRLEPLASGHADGLARAADDPALWPFMPRAGHGEGFAAWWDAAVAGRAAGTEAPFVVRAQADGAILGSTRYFAMVPEHRRLEIGHTWYVRDTWGTTVNPECKLLLMTHAFEGMRYNRVEFRCDARNARSWAAIKKLGAVEEGILRRHMVVQHGHLRDTVQFSVIAEDWPKVKEGLEARVYG